MTLDEFIANSRGKSVQAKNYFYPKVYLEDSIIARVSYTSILDRYDSILDGYKKALTLSIEEAETYLYSPKRLSKRLYGTDQYWFLLLHANQFRSSVQFDFRESLSLQVYTNNGISMLGSILSVDKDFISSNDSAVMKDTKSAQSMLNE